MLASELKSKPFALIDCFSKLWETVYCESYQKTGKDFKHAKLYLELQDGKFEPDMIIARTKVYLRAEGFYAENRHSFTAFINNINSFVAQKKKEVVQVRMETWTCECGMTMSENKQYQHIGTCDKTQPASQETVRKAMDEFETLRKGMSVK